MSTLKRHLDKSELLRVMDVVREWRKSPTGSDEHGFSLMIELMVWTAMRGDEALSFKVSGLDKARGEVHLVDPAKGSSKGTVSVPPALITACLMACEYAELGPDNLFSDILFRGRGIELASKKRHMARLWARLRFLALGAGCRYGMHSIRHAGAVAVYEATQHDLMAVKMFLRHKSITSTQHYVEGMDRAETDKIIGNILKGFR